MIEVNFYGKGWLFRSVSRRRILSQVEKTDSILCGVDEHSFGLGLLLIRIVEKSLRTRLLRNLLDLCAGLFFFIEKDVLEELCLRKVPLY